MTVLEGPQQPVTIRDSNLHNVSVLDMFSLQPPLLGLTLSLGHQEDDLHAPAETSRQPPSPG